MLVVLLINQKDYELFFTRRRDASITLRRRSEPERYVKGFLESRSENTHRAALFFACRSKISDDPSARLVCLKRESSLLTLRF